VQGTIIFSQPSASANTTVDVHLTGLTDGPNPWHVHVWPVTGGDCGPASVAGHYNPVGHPDQGELADHFGDLSGTSVTEVYTSDKITLFGDDSIVGRSIVIHRADASRMACATLGSAKTAVAAFSAASAAAGSVTGDIAFTQVEGGPAVVDVAVAGLDFNPNPWHVHTLPVTDEDCGATGGHYNPAGHPDQGELSTLFGDLNASAVTEQHETGRITLFGDDSIVGRSIVIHRANTSRWVCANITVATSVRAGAARKSTTQRARRTR